MRGLILLLLLALSGCYLRTLYEPAECIEWDVDTLSTDPNRTADTLLIQCETWQAMSDREKCWTNDRDERACP